jgi:hypothetical protein
MTSSTGVILAAPATHVLQHLIITSAAATESSVLTTLSAHLSLAPGAALVLAMTATDQRFTMFPGATDRHATLQNNVNRGSAIMDSVLINIPVIRTICQIDVVQDFLAAPI